MSNELRGLSYYDLRLPSAGLLASRLTSSELLCMARCLPVALLAAPKGALDELIPPLVGEHCVPCLAAAVRKD